MADAGEITEDGRGGGGGGGLPIGADVERLLFNVWCLGGGERSPKPNSSTSACGLSVSVRLGSVWCTTVFFEERLSGLVREGRGGAGDPGVEGVNTTCVLGGASLFTGERAGSPNSEPLREDST